MARPDNRLQGFRKSMLKYQDAMTYSRALLSELPSRLKDGTGRIGAPVAARVHGLLLRSTRSG